MSTVLGPLTCLSTIACNGVRFDLSKEQCVLRLAMDHAMAFAGVDVADDGGLLPRRWRVENSWGAKIADKGYYVR